MKTIKIQVEETQTIKKEVEFNLPCFRKNKNSFFKINKNRKCIQVALYGYESDTIQYRSIEAAFYSDTEESNEAEFNQALEKAITLFKSL